MSEQTTQASEYRVVIRQVVDCVYTVEALSPEEASESALGLWEEFGDEEDGPIEGSTTTLCVVSVETVGWDGAEEEEEGEESQ